MSTTIDLAAAYRNVDALLARHGVGDWPYLIILEVWNHREAGARMIQYAVYCSGQGRSMNSVDGSVHTGAQQSLEAALHVFEEKLCLLLGVQHPDPAQDPAQDPLADVVVP